MRGPFRRGGLILVRWVAGAVVGAVIGGALQLATGVAGWMVVGAAIGFVAVVFWQTLRDPRG